MLTVAMEKTEDLVQQYPIDRQRLTVVGISGGGTASCELIARYPENLAAAVLLADGGPNLADVDRLAKTPSWAFYAKHDPDTPIARVRETVTAIQAAGGTSNRTATDDASHYCWLADFSEHDVVHWLLAQRHGSTNSPPPGSYRLAGHWAFWWPQIWPRLAGISVIVGAAGVYYQQSKSRRRAARKSVV